MLVAAVAIAVSGFTNAAVLLHLVDGLHHPATHLAALDGQLGATDYTELGLPGGHIGMFVTTKSQGIVGNGMVD